MKVVNLNSYKQSSLKTYNRDDIAVIFREYSVFLDTGNYVAEYELVELLGEQVIPIVDELEARCGIFYNNAIPGEINRVIRCCYGESVFRVVNLKGLEYIISRFNYEVLSARYEMSENVDALREHLEVSRRKVKKGVSK